MGVGLTYSSNDMVDMVAFGVSKGQALQIYCEAQGIKSDEVISFGDMLNDVEMLQFSGTSYAMANAVPEVKAVAKYTTLSNEDEGVASAIEALLELPN